MLIEKKLDFKRLDLHQHYKELAEGYDKAKQCYDLNLKKVENLVKNKLKKDNLVIDSHISHLLPKKLVNLCIVLTCSNLKNLEKRLQERKYKKNKVRENLDAEIFQICLIEAKEAKHKIITFDTNKKRTQKEFLEKIKKHL